MNKPMPVVVYAGGKESTGTVRIHSWTMRDRWMRALPILAGWWAAAAASVLLAYVNFVLVPVFFLCGIVFARRTYSQTGHFTRIEAPCPFCAHPLALGSTAISAEWPLEIHCQSCHEPVKVEAATEAEPLRATG